LHRNDLTAEGAENAEGENTEMNNSDATGFDITFRKPIKSTPYFLLGSGVGLLFFAFFAEALPWKDEAISSLLEGIPKLLSGVNIALYFWFVCKGLILRSLHCSNKTSNPELSKFN